MSRRPPPARRASGRTGHGSSGRSPSKDAGDREADGSASKVSVRKVFAAVAAVVTFAVSATTLVDWIGKSRHHEPTAVVLASFRTIRHTGDERLLDYLVETHRAIPRDRAALQQLGLRFIVGVRITGSLGRHFKLRWRLLDERGVPLTERSNGRLIYEQEPWTVTPRAVTDKREGFAVWIPYPTRPGRYTARFILVDASGASDDERDLPLRITRVPPV